jgi:hypothetical protein
VAPLSKLKGMLGVGNGATNIVVGGSFKLKGSDLQLVIERENKRQTRTRG